MIAIRASGDGPRPEWRYNPGPEERLDAGDTLIVLGRPEQIDELARLAGT